MIFETIKSNRVHFIYIFLLFVVSVFLLRDYAIGPYWMPMRGDPDLPVGGTDFAYHASNSYILKNSLINFEMPLWNPFTLSGMPFLAKPQVQVFNPTWIFLLIAPTAWLGLKWSFLFHFFLAGIGMYIFMHFYMKQDAKICFLSALFYILNANLQQEISSGHMNVVNVYAWLPFILLFTLLALSRTNYVIYSVFAGISFSFLIFGGSPQEALYVVFLFLFILLVYSFGKDFFQRLAKSFLVGALVLIIFFGISAVKILPTLEMMKVTQIRASGISFENLVGDGIFSVKNFASPFITFFGIIGILLLPFAFLSIKKKKTLLLATMFLFSIAMLSKSPLIYFLWKYAPFVNKMRGIFKIVFLFTFPASVLFGIGAHNMTTLLQNKLKISNKRFLNLIYLLIFALVIVNLAIFGPKQVDFADIRQQLEKNQVMQYMNKDTEIFRFKAYETNGIDWGTDFYSIPLNLQDIYGYDNIWLYKYMPVFLSVANSQPAKMFGILNMKYMTSMQPLNISGFSLVKKFEECGFYSNGIDICQPKKSDGPYLYKNDMFLPRAYFVDNALLVLGESNNIDNIIFFVMLNNNFDPSNTVVISESSLDKIDLEILQKFKAVILAKAPNDADSYKLRGYAGNGGVLLPNIFAGENQLSEAKINSILYSLNTNYPKIKKAGINYGKYGSASVNLNGQKGFLVLSEQYSTYPGWKAAINNKETSIFNADNIISAVYIKDGSGTLKFEYKPKSFKYGALITIAAFLILIIFFSIKLFYKRDKSAIPQ